MLLCPNQCHGDVIKDRVGKMKYCLNWFSNMSRLEKPIIHQNISYWTVENFYQAMKTEDVSTRRKISLLNPYKSKSFTKKIKIREDWECIKLSVMKLAIKRKFSQPYWRERLNKCNWPIIEWNNWGDTFWGVDILKGGENNLGKLIEAEK